jgi:DNA end-binding protein Ku
MNRSPLSVSSVVLGLGGEPTSPDNPSRKFSRNVELAVTLDEPPVRCACRKVLNTDGDGFSILYLVRPYYIVPDGKVGHDAYAVIRETIRSLDQVAIARVVLTSREHVIALEARDNGLMGMLLRYPYEVRDAGECFDEIQDVKITKDMLDLARHMVESKAGHFDPAKFEDRYEAAPQELLDKKQKGQPISPPRRIAPSNVFNLMDALKPALRMAADRRWHTGRLILSRRPKRKLRRRPGERRVEGELINRIVFKGLIGPPW